MTFFPEREFNSRTCVQCGKCSIVCPSSAIMSVDGSPGFLPERCIHCGHCGMFCPVNAFSLTSSSGYEETLNPAGFRALLHRRYSVREFSDKVPSKEEIDEVLSVVSTSPTGRNAQGIVLRVAWGRVEVAALLAPVLRRIRFLARIGIPQLAGRLTGMSDYVNRIKAGEDLIFRGAPCVVFFHVPKRNITARSDGVIAAATVMHHAVSMGMGTLWNGIAEKLYPLMGPWHDTDSGRTRLTAVLCLGYSSQVPVHRAPDREYSLRPFFSSEGS